MKLMRKRAEEEKRSAAVKAAAGLASGIALTVLGVACVSAIYCKMLMDISYLHEGDVYEE